MTALRITIIPSNFHFRRFDKGFHFGWIEFEIINW